MIQFYNSGRVRTDPYTVLAKRVQKYRMFSAHPDYMYSNLQWLEDTKDDIYTIDDFLRKYPKKREVLINKDKSIQSNIDMTKYDLTVDTISIIKRIEKNIPMRKRHDGVMIDSGAFSSWQSGNKITVNDVIKNYNLLMEAAQKVNYNPQIVNLDVIPPSYSTTESQPMYDESDKNYERLRTEFGNIVLPVYHHGEPLTRLDDIIGMSNGRICISPDNNRPEKQRCTWANDVFIYVKNNYQHIKCHGLATTGSKMLANNPWDSVDSATWVMSAAFGELFYAQKDPLELAVVNAAADRYKYDLDYKVKTNSGYINGKDLGLNEKNTRNEVKNSFIKAGVDEKNIPIFSDNRHSRRHIDKITDRAYAKLEENAANIDMPFTILFFDYRARHLYNSIEIDKYANMCKGPSKKVSRASLF